MKPRLTGLNFEWMGAESLQRVVSAFSYAQQPLYFVGGCVRDSIFQNLSTLTSPSSDLNFHSRITSAHGDAFMDDIDLATPLNPDQIIAILNQAHIDYTQVGRAFGTIVAVVGSTDYQITSFRRDVETDGRWAQVEYTDDLIQDASRRDFTINALYLTPNGDLYDPYRGLDDLRNGQVQFIGTADSRICEDYLRILRYYRFYARFGRLIPGDDLLIACSRYAPQLKKLSVERVQSELIKLLEVINPYKALHLLHQGRIFKQFLDVTIDLSACDHLHTIESQLKTVMPPLLRFKIVFASHSQQLARHLKFPRQHIHYINQLDLLSTRPNCNVHQWLYWYGPGITQSYLCLRAVQQKSTVDRTQWQQTIDWIQPSFPLSGHDAMAINLTGPNIGHALKKVEQWWVDQHCHPDRSACLQQLHTYHDYPDTKA